MAAGEGFEAVIKFSTPAFVRVPADFRGNHNPIEVTGEHVSHRRIDQIRTEESRIRIAAREQIWPWLSEHELHALCDQKGGGKGEGETHPANVPLPEFPPPNERLGGASASRWSRDKDHAYDEDDASRCNEGDEYEEPCRDRLMVLEGVRDVEIDGREGAVIWKDVFPACADCSDDTSGCQHMLKESVAVASR